MVRDGLFFAILLLKFERKTIFGNKIVINKELTILSFTLEVFPHIYLLKIPRYGPQPLASAFPIRKHSCLHVKKDLLLFQSSSTPPFGCSHFEGPSRTRDVLGSSPTRASSLTTKLLGLSNFQILTFQGYLTPSPVAKLDYGYSHSTI